jgi:hypothetical protein
MRKNSPLLYFLPLFPSPIHLHSHILPTLLAGLLISAPVVGLWSVGEVGFDGRSFRSKDGLRKTASRRQLFIKRPNTTALLFLVDRINGILYDGIQ